MEQEIIFIVEESAEGGYEAKALGHSICTEADSYDEIKKWFMIQCYAISRSQNDRRLYGFTLSGMNCCPHETSTRYRRGWINQTSRQVRL